MASQKLTFSDKYELIRNDPIDYSKVPTEKLQERLHMIERKERQCIILEDEDRIQWRAIKQELKRRENPEGLSLKERMMKEKIEMERRLKEAEAMKDIKKETTTTTPPTQARFVFEEEIEEEEKRRKEERDTLGLEDAIEKEDFLHSSQRVLLTYKTWIDKKKLEDLARTKWGPKDKSKRTIYVAHETGKKTGIDYQHTHVLIDWGKVFQTKNVRYFDIDNIHPNISTVYKQNWFKTVKYVCKDDKEAKLEMEKNSGKLIVQNITNADTLIEAVESNLGNINDVMGILYLGNVKFHEVMGIERIFGLKKPTLKRFHWEPDMQWQKEFIEEFTPHKSYNHRKVIWIADEKGGMGKTCLTKWLLVNHENDWMISSDMGTSRDAATIIMNSLQGGWNCHGCIINLTRTAEKQKHDRIYQ